ncbi:hypothetical protein P691DRAFT_100450 [Macrolepiota fuliginosa MF-IS2]|uniref:Uncharacterized protein n=1 Tax=Macrolepiota fuliginosa MF-IS2 TaxID=1400762 RepID=A0A9P6C9G6_9AGAR|nr:hypothetical protein P691DRAFT_100450 [Macrolepiota fuliginosa MF-IS2]
MALTQSARMPRPSWDEEVVPALRKRLETESRNLARRMSAISMSSNTDDSPISAFASSAAAFADSASLQTQQNASYQQPGSSTQRPHPGYQYHPPDHPNTPNSSTRVNGAQPARKPVATTSFHRSRTYSQPYATDMNGTRMNGVKSGNNNAPTSPPSRSPRLPEIKPTRIPIASRSPPSANTPTMPYLNGAGASHSTTPTPMQTPHQGYTYNFPTSASSQANLGPSQPSRIINEPAPFNTAASSSSSIYNIHVDELGSRHFEPSTTAASRTSVDSEERPFEHWYRGEVSRNGGVGELRVGRRQEMLEIANYGHAINNKRKAIASRKAALLALEENSSINSHRMRKRADSVAGGAGFQFGIGGMRERGSLYLDEERAYQIGRVLDEDPLTDLDGEGSDIGSISTHNHHQHYRYTNHNADYNFLPGVGDITTTTATSPGSPRTFTESLPPQSPITAPSSYEHEYSYVDGNGYEGTRSDTPTQQHATPTPSHSIPAAVTSPTATPSRRSKSRQNSSSSRIPMPSSERRSSESRGSTPTQHTTGSNRGQPVVDLTTLTPSPPHPPSSPPLPSAALSPSTTGPNSRSPATPSTPISNKRGISPGPNSTPTNSAIKKPRTTPGSVTPSAAAKTRPKPKSALKKPVVGKENDRKSVAQYPNPGGGGDGNEDGDMADMIPSWTQPKPREGNWDDVVLPVVARKKGLDDYYEKADGSPQPKKKVDAPVAPAPGTFGYDGTKYRRERSNDNEIEMDEFGRPNNAATAAVAVADTTAEEDDMPEESDSAQQDREEREMMQISTAHDNIRVPIRPPPSPAPFAHYAPIGTQQLVVEEVRVPPPAPVVESDDDKGGWC